MDQAPAVMLRTELRECMDTICWTTDTVSRVFGVRRQTVSRWLAGTMTVGSSEARHLRLLRDFHRTHPYAPVVTNERDHGNG